MKRILLLGAVFVSCVAYAQPQLKFTCYNLDGDTLNSSPLEITKYNGKLIFSALIAQSNERELWMSDGTIAGTGILMDIWQGTKGSNPYGFKELNGKLYFSADDSVHGNELWATDATTSGTQLAVDIYPGKEPSDPNIDKALFGNKLLFRAEDSAHWSEPWISDGTTSGTQMIKDIRPGKAHSLTTVVPRAIVEYKGRAYFEANEGTNGDELWATDGTLAGTKIVKNLNSGNNNSDPRCLFIFNNQLFFKATGSGIGREWWVTDGDDAATHVLKDLNGSASSVSSSLNDKMFEYKGKAYFAANDGLTGSELWVTDGTDAGTKLVKDITTGPGNSTPSRYAEFNGKLYFSADDSIVGRELWVTDGTAQGTKLVKDILPGFDDSNPMSFTVYKNHLYFVAEQDNGDRQLFVTDGTDSGTTVLAPATAYKSDPFGTVTYDYELVLYDSMLFFIANYDSAGRELWSIEDITKPGGVVNTLNDARVFSVFPNPNKGTFTIQLHNTDFKQGVINVSDIAGRVIHSQAIKQGANTATIQLTNPPKGIYTVQVKLDEEVSTEKIVVQ